MSVFKNAGAFPWDRDDIDRRIIPDFDLNIYNQQTTLSILPITVSDLMNNSVNKHGNGLSYIANFIVNKSGIQQPDALNP